jgi:phosphate transport system permease protein
LDDLAAINVPGQVDQEIAPLLFTMTFSDYWLSHGVMEPTASLAVLIYNFSKSPFENQKEIAWAASLVLVLLVLALNLSGQFLSRRASRKLEPFR